MINIMSLRQVYEWWEIDKIWWINGDDNLVDAMTKVLLNKALERFINTNKLTIRVEGYVDRSTWWSTGWIMWLDMYDMEENAFLEELAKSRKLLVWNGW
jgi:hypothetical protein